MQRLPHLIYIGCSTFKGIPRGQFLRARKICSENEEYSKHQINLTNKFANKGYDRAILKQTGDEVAQIPRKNLLKYEKKKKTKDLLYISKYHTHAQLV